MQGNSFLIPHYTPKKIIWGQSTSIGHKEDPPYGQFNLAHHVGQNEISLKENWALFQKNTGISRKEIATCQQVHGNTVSHIKTGGNLPIQADALISTTPSLGVGIFTADCVPILIAMPKLETVAAIHSGWRSTEQNIVKKTIDLLKQIHGPDVMKFASIFIGASISCKNYEVGKDVAEKFDSRFTKVIPKTKQKFLLDVALCVEHQLLNEGVNQEQIERNQECTFENKDKFYSYRRTKTTTGRMLSFIKIEQ